MELTPALGAAAAPLRIGEREFQLLIRARVHGGCSCAASRGLRKGAGCVLCFGPSGASQLLRSRVPSPTALPQHPGTLAFRHLVFQGAAGPRGVPRWGLPLPAFLLPGTPLRWLCIRTRPAAQHPRRCIGRAHGGIPGGTGAGQGGARQGRRAAAGPWWPRARPRSALPAPPGRAACPRLPPLCPQHGGAGRQGARAQSGARLWAERGGARPACGREEGRRAGLGKVSACPAPARSPAGRRGRSYLAVGSERWLPLSLPGRLCHRSNATQPPLASP